MAKRKVKRKKTVRTTAKRKVSSKPKRKAASSKSASVNKNLHWAAYKALEKKLGAAWDKLRTDVKRKAGPRVIAKSRNQLALLLGECNYMARQYMAISSKK